MSFTIILSLNWSKRLWVLLQIQSGLILYNLPMSHSSPLLSKRIGVHSHIIIIMRVGSTLYTLRTMEIECRVVELLARQSVSFTSTRTQKWGQTGLFPKWLLFCATTSAKVGHPFRPCWAHQSADFWKIKVLITCWSTTEVSLKFGATFA